MQFAVKIEAFNTGTPMTYKEAYEKRFREILLEELGPDSLKKIEDEASELARADLEREWQWSVFRARAKQASTWG